MDQQRDYAEERYNSQLMRDELELRYPEDEVLTPPPYDWAQAKEIAKLVVQMLETLSKSWTDATEAHEYEWPMEKIRQVEGVGIVLDSILYSFRTNQHAYSEACEEGATAQAYYYLEDF